MSRVYRSRRDRWITGLCGGLAESFGISAGILRLLLVIAIPFTSGAVILLYLIASLVVSKEPYQPHDPFHTGGWNSNYPPGPGYGSGERNGRYDNDRRFSHQEFKRDFEQRFSGRRGPFEPHTPPRPPHFGSEQRSQAGGFGRMDESNLDYMMGDIEKKAMQKELDELRAKLAKYENGKQEKGEE
ncbi:PspC domain-containing protein [Paenibacillus pinistramenti]|uniref:PspC domain-containing protein n=1 Tax=Paenibacillus pinistramenti TaxID=1768003 RepID=UPI001109192F|nr:PspC domain-containing protein [Paenibacillus pinistramenti]